ncbi:MAG: single-stranded-DNA-specific exonuclease RecJ [Minwuia sp.]|uniref:single-stranded-DNA-specific exonuclease RecJ n=1 Tax=Minwuia sp. TaxID=2493630 RepID=UPI003A8A3760
MSEPAFLDVEQSLTGRRWQRGSGETRLSEALAQRHGIPELLAEVLVNRGVGIDDCEQFLKPRLKDLMPDPSSFRDMDKAAGLIARCIAERRRLAVFGDYDVDGATSSALFMRYAEAVSGKVAAYIPDRIAEGYGPNLPALRRLAEDGNELIVTVDCGTAAFEVLDSAADEGIRVVVVDHHLAEDRLPKAAAIVNPNRLDCSGGHGNLAAVGVTFLLLVAVNRALRESGWFAERPEPNLLAMLDLVAVGTVCDVVPLTGLNRALVAQGLRVMAERRQLGLTTLGDIARLTGPPSTYHAGFLIGPRLNAGGRVGKSDLGVRLLTTEDPEEATGIAVELDRLNDERRRIEQTVLEEALTLAHRQANRAVVTVAGDGWHPGVIGIVASRVKDRTGRPAIVIARDGATGKGSGRSVKGVDLGAAVTAARQAGLLINGGGHTMAAGLTVESARIDELSAFLDDRLGESVSRAAGARALTIDGAISPAGATAALVGELERAGPYGQGNPEPRVALPDCRLVKADIVGGQHVKMVLAGKSGGRLEAIAFRIAEEPLGATLLGRARDNRPLHLAGHLRMNHWGGRQTVQLTVEDAADPR